MSRLSRVILRVEDMGRAIAFWRDAVGLAPVFESEDFTFLNAGEAQVVLNRVDSPPEPGMTEVVLESDDVAAEYSAMRARGVPFEVDLRAVTSDGDRDLLAAHFHDPDGNLASLTGWVSAQGDQR